MRNSCYREGFLCFSRHGEVKELGSENQLLKIPNYLKTPPASFSPRHRVPPFSSPPRMPFRGCWKSAAAAARDLILVEVDGKCQSVAETVKVLASPGELAKAAIPI